MRRSTDLSVPGGTVGHRPHNGLYVISDAGELVDRYGKRFCSHTEINHFYSPGSDPVVFDVDGYRFGCMICVEVNFPHLFSQYERLGVECLLLSAYPVDSIFELKARARPPVARHRPERRHLPHPSRQRPPLHQPEVVLTPSVAG
ncbi:carbon-nitrogen hydrolase family protein [Kribbella sp. CWNU-51]